MNVTVTTLGRSAIDTPFSELASTTLVVSDTPVPFTPAVPPAAVGQELALRVAAEDDVVVQLGQWIDPTTLPGAKPVKDYAGNVIGTDPAPEPTHGKSYVAWGNTPRQMPFSAGNSIVLARPGVAAAI